MDKFEQAATKHFGEIKTNAIFQNVKYKDKMFVAVELMKLSRDDEYVDNYRIFPPHMKSKYKDVKARGCCGFVDTMVRCPSGNSYLVGYNHGH